MAGVIAEHPAGGAIGRKIVRVFIHRETHGNDGTNNRDECRMTLELDNGFALYFDGRDRECVSEDGDTYGCGWKVPETLVKTYEDKPWVIQDLEKYVGYEKQETSSYAPGPGYDDPDIHEIKPSLGSYGLRFEEHPEDWLINGRTIVRIGTKQQGSAEARGAEGAGIGEGIDEVELSNGIVLYTPFGNIDIREMNGGRLTYYQIRSDTEMYAKMTEEEKEMFALPWWVRGVHKAQEALSQNDPPRSQIPSAAEHCVPR